MLKKLENLKLEFLKALEEVKEVSELENLGKEYLGKKGKLQDILKGIKDLSVEDKKIVGPEAN
ncbi:phenylalanine--tRNA ligase subunit alpha, partial [Candidatus Gracilibacteria bacterium]